MRRLRHTDLKNVLELLELCSLPIADLSPDKLDDFFGVYENGRLGALGGLELCGSDALLRSLATHPSRRGSGLAREIVTRLEEHARACGIHAIYLLTESASGFFERCGYRGVPRADAPRSIAATAQFTDLCPDSAVFMYKAIAA